MFVCDGKKTTNETGDNDGQQNEDENLLERNSHIVGIRVFHGY